MLRWLPIAAVALALANCGPADTKANDADTAAAQNDGHTDSPSMNHSAMSGELDETNPDRSFAQQMIPHHQGAIAMARQELERGKDPEMRALATRIIAEQEKEIEQLNAWLERSGRQTVR